MGSITIIVEGSTVGTVDGGIPAGGEQVRYEVSETDSARLIAAYAKMYAGRWTEEDGTPRQPDIGEVIRAWADGIVAGSIANVRAHERDEAARAARDAVSDIVVTGD